MNIDDLRKTVAELDATVQVLTELEKVKSKLGRLPNSATKSQLETVVKKLEATSLVTQMVSAEAEDAKSGTDEIPF